MRSPEDRYDIRAEAAREEALLDSIFLSMISKLDAALDARYTSPRGVNAYEETREETFTR